MNILHNKALKRVPFCGILTKFAPKNQKRQLMKRIIVPFTILFSTVWILTSCLKSDNDDTISMYDDTAVTSFSLGTLNRYLHTLSSTGKDSIYKTTVTGTSYQFYINHATREIYNADSLPYGTDVAHVICNITAKNNGMIFIKSLRSDSISYYSNADSIDFTSPRQVIVYSNSGNANRSYTVHVNVHAEDGDTFNWTDMGKDTQLAALEQMKLLACGDKLYVFGQLDGHTVGYVSAPSNIVWKPLAMNFKHLLDADVYQNVIVKGETLYMLDGETLMRSENGADWTPVSAPALRRLMASGAGKLYGISSSGLIMSSKDEGVSWKEELMEESSEWPFSRYSWLPEDAISMACLTSKTNPDVERLILAGNRSMTTYPDDAYAVVWGKTEDLSGDGQESAWSYYSQTGQKYLLPRLSNISMFAYGGALVAFGGHGIGACTQDAGSVMYVSKDGGITWKTNSAYPLPSNNTEGSPFAAALDDDANIWIVYGKSGQLWRGRLNRLGWSEEKKAFFE